MSGVYQCFIPNRLPDLVQDSEMEINISNLAPGKRKYECKIVRGKISSDPKKYANQLWIRFPKGQMHPEPWPLDIIQEIDRIPEKFR